jgi:hypothetical protein
LSAIRPASTAPDAQGSRLSVPAPTPHPTMAPPQAISRPASGSPHPNGVGLPNGSYVPPNQPPSYYVPPQATRVDTFRKVPLKSKYFISHSVETFLTASRRRGGTDTKDQVEHPSWS